LGATPLSSAAEGVGQVQAANGAVTAVDAKGHTRLLGEGAPVYTREVLTTGNRSNALLKLQDGTTMALRPNTVFRMDAFSTQENHESALIRLFKGGLRSVSGFLSKRNPNAVRIQTSVATIGIRGTEYDVRLCGKECAEEERKLDKKPSQAQAQVTAPPPGRIALLHGRAQATGADAAKRPLVAGAAIYEGDLIHTESGSYLVIAFIDKGRVTLKDETDFLVEKMRYDEKDPSKDNAFFRLLKGGLRSMTGLLGKRNPGSVLWATPVSTIGIRGTGFDLLCQGACVAGEPSAKAQGSRDYAALLRFLVADAEAQEAPGGDGLYASVWLGAIVFKLPGGDLIVEQGKTMFLANGAAEPIYLPALPFRMNAPRPDQVRVDHGKLFGGGGGPPGGGGGQGGGPDIPPGLYVSCYQGHCSVQTQQQILELGAGEEGYVGGDGSPQGLPEIPGFQSDDPYLSIINIDVSGLGLDFGNQLGNQKFQCQIQ
jgi:hypothetical protein